MSDNIKHPSHYAEGRNYEPKDVIRDWGLNFNLGNAVKYISRAGRKDDIVQELKKAQEYLQFEIEAIEAERNTEVELKAPIYLNCRCSVEPVADGKDITTVYLRGKPVKRGVIAVEVLKGTLLERVLKTAINQYLNYGAILEEDIDNENS